MGFNVQLMIAQAAVQKARQIASQERTQLNRKPGVSVDVEELARLKGIEIIFADFSEDKISGFLKRETGLGKPVIVVNKSDADRRQRFTIAHELGHFTLHKDENLHVDDLHSAEVVHFRDGVSSQATDAREIEANQFAAELLMPEEEILPILKASLAKGTTLEKTVSDLADSFDVSVLAMTIKLSSLGQLRV